MGRNQKFHFCYADMFGGWRWWSHSFNWHVFQWTFFKKRKLVSKETAVLCWWWGGEGGGRWKRELMFWALALCQGDDSFWRRAHAWNVSTQISLQWSNYVIISVDTTKYLDILHALFLFSHTVKLQTWTSFGSWESCRSGELLCRLGKHDDINF